MAQAGLTVKVTGLTASINAMSKLADGRAVDRRVNAAMKKAAAPMLEFAKSKVPVDQGDLKRSLIINSKKLKNGNRSVRVGPEAAAIIRTSGNSSFNVGRDVKWPARYGHLVEFGHTAFGKFWVRRQPFMRPAVARFGGSVFAETFRTELDKSYRRLAKKINKSK